MPHRTYLTAFIFIVAAGVAYGKVDVRQPVLVVGATGLSGSRVYLLLKQQGVAVRGIVRNASKAREVLGCNRCDASEGIYVADVTKAETLTKPVSGAESLVIATGPDVDCNPYPQNCTCPKGGCPVDIDWHGNVNIITAFGYTTKGLGQVILISADSTTYADNWSKDPAVDPLNGFYKLNAEAFLMNSGLLYTIVKPCGLTNSPPATATLTTFHNDLNKTLCCGRGIVARADIARLISEAFQHPEVSGRLRFNFCSYADTPTRDTDLLALLRSALYRWEPPNGLMSVVQ